MLTGKIFNIQRFSIHDGPGIRTIVFLKGCPLRCPWCSNPESQLKSAQVVFRPELCIGCRKCVSACPKGLRGEPEFKLCNIACGKCVSACPTNAMEQVGFDMTIDEVMEEVKKDRSFYKKSGGGLTLSGGEPLTQHEFALNLLAEAKKILINTAIETCGYAPQQDMMDVFKLVDTVLFDVKHMNSQKHARFTGVSNELILDNLRKAASRRKDNIILRIPLIGAFNDDERNIAETARLAKELGIKEIHLLPYHRYAENKYRKLYLDYDFDAYTPSDSAIDSCIELIQSFGLIGRKS